MECPKCGKDLIGDVVFLNREIVSEIRCVDEDCTFSADTINSLEDFEEEV